MDSPLDRPISFGIIPAAGRSVRMGQAKLKMPWGDSTVIQHVIAAWQRSRVDRVVAVVRPDDDELALLCETAGAIVVRPVPAPPEMKDSVEVALRAIASQFAPSDAAVWMLAPADMPRLSAVVIDGLLASHRPAAPAILVPVHTVGRQTAGDEPATTKRGHPVLFPWAMGQDVSRLNEDQGVNALLSANPVREVVVDEPAILDDLDTIEDYRRLSGN